MYLKISKIGNNIPKLETITSVVKTKSIYALRYLKRYQYTLYNNRNKLMIIPSILKIIKLS